MTDEAKVFETEAAETRERMAATIDDLQARLSPKALVDNAIGSLSSAGSHAVESMRGAATGHPLILGAIGLAVGVGLLARSRVHHAAVEYGDSYAAYADYDDGYAENLADKGRSGARGHLDAMQEQAHATVDDNPLAVLVVGIATGALLGAVIPVSSVELTMFGEVRSRIAAAGDAALNVAKSEFDSSKLSLAGGPAGMADRFTQSLVAILAEAGAAVGKPVSTR